MCREGYGEFFVYFVLVYISIVISVTCRCEMLSCILFVVYHVSVECMLTIMWWGYFRSLCSCLSRKFCICDYMFWVMLFGMLLFVLVEWCCALVFLFVVAARLSGGVLVCVEL